MSIQACRLRRLRGSREAGRRGRHCPRCPAGSSLTPAATPRRSRPQRRTPRGCHPSGNRCECKRGVSQNCGCNHGMGSNLPRRVWMVLIRPSPPAAGGNSLSIQSFTLPVLPPSPPASRRRMPWAGLSLPPLSPPVFRFPPSSLPPGDTCTGRATGRTPPPGLPQPVVLSRDALFSGASAAQPRWCHCQQCYRTGR